MCGVFPEATWQRLIGEAGLEVVDVDALEDPTRASTRSSSARNPLDVVREGIYSLVTNIRSFPDTGENPMLETPMLTTRQQEIWQFLAEYVDDHGYPPTVREIGDAVGLASPSTVHAHLANLERAGLLRRDPTKPRAIELVGRRAPTTAESRRGPGPAPARRQHRRGRAAARRGGRSRTRSPSPSRSAATPTSSSASRATR